MFDLGTYAIGLVAILTLAVATWIVSLIKHDVSIVDCIWSLLFLVAVLAYAQAQPSSPRMLLIIVLVGCWAVRLSVYLSWRNWGEPEDRRYQKIRRHNDPGFALKSLYLVFGLQAVLAWIISLPLLAATNSTAALGALDAAGTLLCLIGLGFETVGDWQLARFKARPNNRDAVMRSGLWRYTRHPNYFGDCCVWWGFYLIALAAGGWWSIIGPALMTFLLLRVSGVALLEKDIGKRRPEYATYIAQTNAFVPGRPKRLA